MNRPSLAAALAKSRQKQQRREDQTSSLKGGKPIVFGNAPKCRNSENNCNKLNTYCSATLRDYVSYCNFALTAMFSLNVRNNRFLHKNYFCKQWRERPQFKKKLFPTLLVFLCLFIWPFKNEMELRYFETTTAATGCLANSGGFPINRSQSLIPHWSGSERKTVPASLVSCGRPTWQSRQVRYAVLLAKNADACVQGTDNRLTACLFLCLQPADRKHLFSLCSHAKVGRMPFAVSARQLRARVVGDDRFSSQDSTKMFCFLIDCRFLLLSENTEAEKNWISRIFCVREKNELEYNPFTIWLQVFEARLHRPAGTCWLQSDLTLQASHGVTLLLRMRTTHRG